MHIIGRAGTVGLKWGYIFVHVYLLRYCLHLQVFMSEVDNNLGASFVILGLVTSVPDVQQQTWTAFTDQTLFLRPHVRTVAYCLRVLQAQRAEVERRYNGTFFFRQNGTKVTRGLEPEYAPLILQSDVNITSFLIDAYSFPILKISMWEARDTGNFSLSAPYQSQGLWRMASFLPHFGDLDPSTLKTEDARRAACVGYVVTILNVEEVFGAVVSRLVL